MKSNTAVAQISETNAIMEDIKKMWREAFKPSSQWLDMYFDRVYRYEDLMTLTAGDDDDMIASSLLLQRYTMYFHQTPMPVGYISGAVTRRQYRDRGYMKELMQEALVASRLRGDVLLTLIPASRHLYFYYEKLGYTTVFYIDEERYTAMHEFNYTGQYEAVDPRDNHEVYNAVDALLRKRDNTILHSYADFQAILADVTLDGGHTVALRDNNTGEIAAVALAAPSEDRVTVREILAMNPDAREAALDRVHKLYPDRPITVATYPDSRHIPIHARGMARIVNAKKLLSAYAARYPKLKLAIKLYDSHLADNCHIYIIDRGEVVVNDGFGGKIDLDVTQEILLSILCSDRPIGDIFDLPTARPYMSMMMD